MCMKRLILALALSLCAPAYASDPQDGFSTVFTPFASGTTQYLDWIDQKCHSSLYVADFTFTSQDIADKYVALQNSGVDVHVILDKMQTKSVKKERPLIEELRQAGVEVIITTSPRKSAIMHDKFSVADGLWVEDGSYNYTDSANDQCNVLNFNTIASPKRAALFLGTWHEIKDFAENGNQKRTAHHRNRRRNKRH